VDTTGVRLAANMPASSATIKTTAPPDLTNYGDGAVLLISDCEKAAIFQITNSQVTAGGTELNIVHNDGNAGVTPGNSQKELTPDGSSFQTDASVFAVQTQVFFIAPGSGTNNRGDTPLSLWRKFANNAPVELVEGVEDLQVLYGFDTDGDRVPNRYSGTIAGQDTSTIVTVRVSLTANSVDVVTEEGDGLLRRTFSKTIALRNRIAAGA
jgi:type IV pilus assembly protein PilW